MTSSSFWKNPFSKLWAMFFAVLHRICNFFHFWLGVMMEKMPHDNKSINSSTRIIIPVIEAELRKVEESQRKYFDTIRLLRKKTDQIVELTDAAQASDAKISKLKIDLATAVRNESAMKEQQWMKVSGELRDLQTKYDSAADTIESLCANKAGIEQLEQENALLKESPLTQRTAAVPPTDNHNDAATTEMPSTKEDAVRFEMLECKVACLETTMSQVVSSREAKVKNLNCFCPLVTEMDSIELNDAAAADGVNESEEDSNEKENYDVKTPRAKNRFLKPTESSKTRSKRPERNAYGRPHG